MNLFVAAALAGQQTVLRLRSAAAAGAACRTCRTGPGLAKWAAGPARVIAPRLRFDRDLVRAAGSRSG